MKRIPLLLLIGCFSLSIFSTLSLVSCSADEIESTTPVADVDVTTLKDYKKRGNKDSLIFIYDEITDPEQQPDIAVANHAEWYCSGKKIGTTNTYGGVVLKDGYYYGVTYTTDGVGSFKYYALTYSQVTSFCGSFRDDLKQD